MIKFWFHYNKPKSLEAGKPIITLHYNGRCHFVEGLEIHVSTWSKFNKEQPHFVMAGEASDIKIHKNKALIWNEY